ncbi:MAG: hypothetical protein ABIQ52_08345 [Vicinamibacterales bacterium]
MPDAFAIDQARAACVAALEQAEDLAPLWRACRSGQPELVEGRRVMPHVRVDGDTVPRLAKLKEKLEQQGYPVAGGAFERMLIVSAAHDSLDELMALPVDERVREFFCQNFVAYAAGRVPEPFELTRASFVCMARISTLSRFPAGQLDWEVSGIPRSWLLRVPTRRLHRLAAAILFELGGLGPAFFSHVNPNRRNQGILLERESLRSYHRMARTMARQPEIRGLITASWLHSPDTFAISPHLSWLNAVFLENSGHIIPLGRVDVESGVLHRSPERQQAYEAGSYTPTEALVIWPRHAMLAWAAQHEELRDDRVVRTNAALRMREARA